MSIAEVIKKLRGSAAVWAAYSPLVPPCLPTPRKHDWIIKFNYYRFLISCYDFNCFLKTSYSVKKIHSKCFFVGISGRGKI